MRKLRIILHLIVNSMLSLFWVLIILAGVTYVFAILLTQGATEYLNSPDDNLLADHADMRYRFGSLFSTMYTLFQCITGGMNWGDASRLVRHPGEFVIIGYVCLMMFAVLNIVNGVFVDGAIDLANRDRETMLQKQKGCGSFQNAIVGVFACVH